MTIGSSRTTPPRRLLLILFLTLAWLAGSAPPAAAQNPISDFFGSLFAPRRPPPLDERRARPIHRPRPKPAATSKPAASGAPGAEVQGPRPPPSFFIAVLGDSQANMLAQGLAEAFADDPRVAILNKAKEDSGLVRDDFYDWPAAAKALLDGPQHIDVAVIQIGINDDQKLRLGGDNTLEPLSKPFNDVYAKRVEEIAAAFHDKNVPLIWVGLPIMRRETLANAALVFNDIDRQYAEAQGAHYVDLWVAFSDENSLYRAWGPDINGVIVRLRAADGVHFNKVGARKAAHFVEPEIRKVLEAALKPPETPAISTPEAPTQPAQPSPPGEAPAAPTEPAPKPIAGKIETLTDATASPGGTLAVPPEGHRPPAPQAAPAQPGRADDFSWPAK
jgi:hypothetical protein